MIDEFDEGREPVKSMDILKAVRWGIDSWHHDVSPSAIENCWIKSGLLGPRFGPETRPRDYREAPHGAHEEVPETETLEQVERSISMLIERVAADRGIQEAISTEDFLSPIGERVEDSSDDVEQQIVEMYGGSEHEQNVDEADNTEEATLPKPPSTNLMISWLDELILNEMRQDNADSEELILKLGRHKRVLLERERMRPTIQTSINQYFTR